MKLTPPMQDALHKLGTHEIHGNTINTGERLHTIPWNTVKALYRRGMLTHVREHCWAEQYNAQGELMHRYTVPVYVLSDAGKETMEMAQHQPLEPIN